MDNIIPEGWIWTKIQHVADLNMGQSPPSSTYNDEGTGLPFFQGKAEFGKVYPTVRKYCSDPVKIADPNDILISVRAPVGPTNLCEVTSCIGRGLAAIKANSATSTKFLLFFFKKIEPWLSLQGSGSTFTAINKNILNEIDFPLPPLAEQRRIVAKLDTAMQRVEASQARLEKLPGLLKQFRQAVLAAAVSGRLTEAWRAENPVQETGADLLARIREERRAQWEEKQRAKQSDKQLILNDGWKQKYEEPAEPDKSELPELPEGWVYDSVGNSIKIIDYRGRTPPFSGDNQDIPHLRSSNVKRGKIIWEGLAYVSAETYDEFMTRGIPNVGDVLLTTEAPLGEVALVPDIKFSLAQRMMILHPLAGLDSQFLMFQFMSETIQTRLKERGTGTTVTGVSAKHFKPMAIAIPPLLEQEEIARQVTHYFELADAIEIRSEQVAATVEQLPQALLAKAFSGQLVPQDPNDEPASVLLERLRNAPAPAKPKRGRKAPVSTPQLQLTVPQSLHEILTQHSDGISPEKLFSLAGFTEAEVDAFYQELAQLQPQLEETKPTGESAKTWPNTSTTLRLKSTSHAD